MNAFEVAKATSRAFLHANFQVNRSLAGRDDASVTSAAERITTVLSDVFAAAQRFICSAVYTSAGFNNSPEPTTMCEAGTLIEYSKLPYSK